MRSEPTILVECDYCGSAEDFDMTATARGGYDDRYLEDRMKGRGWHIVDDLDLCCDGCLEHWKAEEEKKQNT